MYFFTWFWTKAGEEWPFLIGQLDLLPPLFLSFSNEFLCVKSLLIDKDIDNSGAIDKKEMVGVMKAIYAMVDGNVSGAVRGGTEEKASKHAERLFVLIDVDGE